MQKYAKVIDNTTKKCIVGEGTDTTFYTAQGMTLQNVEQAYTGDWYLDSYAPTPPSPEADTYLGVKVKIVDNPVFADDGILYLVRES